jgi:hypothetical protein
MCCDNKWGSANVKDKRLIISGDVYFILKNKGAKISINYLLLKV